MENGKIHVLFVCGMGMGTSTMAELGVKRNLEPYKIAADMQHTSLGMMDSLRDWADIIIILKNLFSRVTPRDNEHFIPVVNVMDAKGICSQIDAIVVEHFPEAKG